MRTKDSSTRPNTINHLQNITSSAKVETKYFTKSPAKELLYSLLARMIAE
jgi:hypothetical protein